MNLRRELPILTPSDGTRAFVAQTIWLPRTSMREYRFLRPERRGCNAAGACLQSALREATKKSLLRRKSGRRRGNA